MSPVRNLGSATSPTSVNLDNPITTRSLCAGIASLRITAKRSRKRNLLWQGYSDLARDHVAAVRDYSIAAGHGIVSAERKLAIAYANGDGVPADDEQMLRWEHRAAESGDPMAEGMLGYAIMIGLDGTYDYVEAATWLTLAAESARAGKWRIQTASYSQDVQRKLTASEQKAYRARLARWRSTLDGE
jgi:TPR repeat protein